jgi:SNF2 family DNA or RNA helicase
MINLKYFSDHLELSLVSNDGSIIPIDDWLIQIDNPSIFNVVNDMIVNGLVGEENGIITLSYNDVSQLDDFEYSTLNLPKPYPFDIFIDLINSSGLTDINLKLRYSFQDFAYENGSGNILFNQEQLTGGFLKGEVAYLLKSGQFRLIEEIKYINSSKFIDSSETLKAVARIQTLASKANAVVSRILYNTIIVSPPGFKLEIEQIGDDKFKLRPEFERIDMPQFNKSFSQRPVVKKVYQYNKNKKKVRVVIDETKNQDGNSLFTELEKLKKKETFSSKEIDEIYNYPTKFWDTDLVDLNEFGNRVIELGIYKPRFYPFISPYKSQWIPGIVIENKKEGNRYLKIKDKVELKKLEKLLSQSQENGDNTISFKGETIDANVLPEIIENARKQLNTPNKPVTNSKLEKNKKENQTKVLIINENTDQSDYSEINSVITQANYSFHPIENLSHKIQLKNHQKDGIAWLQTLSKPPYSIPGALLADDMGLGKTIQVLYFVEWYSQNTNKKPILVVAPVSLLENWQNEYQKFFPKPGLETVTLWGNAVRNYILPNNKESTISNLSKNAIYFTTYETLRKQQIPLGLIDWGVIILDEAQKIKTPGTFVTNAAKALKADFKIAMTGTPIENTLMDLWCIMDFCSPGLLDSAKSFANQFQKPLKDQNTDYVAMSDSLKSKIGVSLLRRMKIDVISDLPEIKYLKYKEVMPSEQYDLYRHELSEIEKLKADTLNKNPVLLGIFNLRSISDHPFIKHYQIENIPTDKLIAASAKLKKVISLLKEIQYENEKVIIFTENRSMQRVLRLIIAERFEINPSIINGETPTGKSKKDKARLSRQQEIDKYQKAQGFNIIIMSPVAAGFGLNITEANNIIHYTRHWNPAKEQQATDRAYRIGQKRTVKVYFPLAVSPNDEIKTFDIVLDELLNRKSQLATSTLFPMEQIEIGREEFISAINTENVKTNSILIDNIEAMDKLQPLMFEAAIALLLEMEKGGDTWLTPITNDKGADIMHFNEDMDMLIQVKQSLSKLGISSGQEISYAVPEYNTKHNRKFHTQIVTNSYFNQNAISLAKQHNIELVDREIVKKWILQNPLSIVEIEKKLSQRV